eukprot:CAMPEP_0194664484 /NCGR_PEP_ID=MMETSP0295-20121207/1494_1 /TAXON_ID=39354 /ORGANISM="Heterosigma akashiwo, Strain CCMP2393" /LENGTH=82 /DNA_ID=CAMNT_0039546245 /DNA_START=764 /DNA_END=1009 /DNA_ORIENTATION=+
MRGVVVLEKKKVEAQGFAIDSQGSWSLHAEPVAKEAWGRLGAISRIAHMLDDDNTKMTACQAFVRPKNNDGKHDVDEPVNKS